MEKKPVRWGRLHVEETQARFVAMDAMDMPGPFEVNRRLWTGNYGDEYSVTWFKRPASKERTFGVLGLEPFGFLKGIHPMNS